MELTLLTDIIKKSYRKLKSYIYYSKNLVHIKQLIIIFESNKNFEDTFNTIAIALINKDIKYFDELIRKIDYIPQIKKVRMLEPDNDNIVCNKSNNGHITIEKVNYFIHMPIELYILDAFWTLLIGKKFYDEKYSYKYVKANNFAYNLFNESDGLDGIDFDSLKLYQPYYKNYISWKNGAINKANQLYKNNKDLMIISLDLTSYFYTVNIDFNMFTDKSKLGKYDFSFVTNMIEKIYKYYSDILANVSTILIKNNTIIPIGLLSSGFMANIYLTSFDKSVLEVPNVEYYSRYVDDILIVVPYVVEKDALSIIKEKFSDIFEFDEKYIKLKQFENVKIQNDKIKIIMNYANSPKSLLESLKSNISNPSDINLMPNINYSDLDNFLSDVYNKKTDSLKIRDTDDLELNKYKLMTFISSYVMVKKNTLPLTNKNNKKNKYEKLDVEMSKQLDLFFDNINLFSLWDRWEKIFEFTYLNNDDMSLTNQLLNKIMSVIETDLYMDVKDVKNKYHERILNKLKKNLLMILQYSLASAFALKPLKHKNNLPIVCKSNKLSPKIRNANLMNHNLVGIPLANYLRSFHACTKDLYNMSESDISKLDYNKNVFDKMKIKYSPRFIHLGEYMLCRNLMDIENLNDSKFALKLLDEYQKITNLNSDFFKVEDITGKIPGYEICNINLKYSYEWFSSGIVNVAMANVNLKDHNMIKSNHICMANQKLIENKETLYRLLNQCNITSKSITNINEKIKLKSKSKLPIDFIVFPELYVPFEWLSDLMYYSRKTGTAIITGVKYCKTNTKLINTIATIIPFKDDNNYNYSSLFLREKNDYAPDEKELIISSQYDNPTKKTSFNYLFNWNEIRFAIYNCYELTDIKSRALLKSKVDIMFAPQLNKDVAYFSNIIESTSRDNGCFVVQVNTSNYGDTRIVGPYKKDCSTIAAISGGIRDSIHIGSIDLDEYKKYRAYEKTDKFLDDIKKKYKNKNKRGNKKFEKYKKSSARLE